MTRLPATFFDVILSLTSMAGIANENTDYFHPSTNERVTMQMWNIWSIPQLIILKELKNNSDRICISLWWF